MYEIDVIIEKKEKWTFKEMLVEKKLKYIEWFIEFDSESCIISFDINNEKNLNEICSFLKEKSPRSRIVFRDGNSVKPAKENIKDIYSIFLSKTDTKEK